MNLPKEIKDEIEALCESYDVSIRHLAIYHATQLAKLYREKGLSDKEVIETLREKVA